MKYAHIADCHIGSWRDPKLRDISTRAFVKTINVCLNEKVDFILISGDLFNTSLPSIDYMKEAVIKLKELKDKDVPVYVIPGSHDFSPSGKTMLDILEHAGLFTNVVKGEIFDNKLKLKFTVDKRTGAKITGMLGKKGMLEKRYYENLITDDLEKEDGYKIFMFHSAITELKTKELEKMDSSPISLLPKNFSYYAGGHVHIIKEASLQGYNDVVYPGPLFPNSFSELEKLKSGGFYIIEVNNNTNNKRYIPIVIYNTFSISIDCSHKSPEQIQQEVIDTIKKHEFINTIVTIRLNGTISSGKVSDIDFKKIFSEAYSRSAYFVMKNTSSLKTKDFEEVKVNTTNTADIEDSIIKEHLTGIEQEIELIKNLMKNLDTEKEEGERVIDFEARIKSNIKQSKEFNELI